MMDDLLHEMIDPEPRRADVSRWRRLGATAAIFALAGLGITSLTTSALFTDRETTAGDLLTGTVDVALDGTQTDASKTFEDAIGGMAPGDSVVKQITVKNSGSLQLRYAVSYDVAEPESATAGLPTLGTDDAADVGTGNLADYLALEVFPTTTAACEPTPNTVDDTLADVGLADAGSGPLDGFTPILGDATTAGFDHGRLLDAGSGSGSSETLCVRVTLDAHAGNALQATGTRIALRFDAVQVVNNPSDTDQQG